MRKFSSTVDLSGFKNLTGLIDWFKCPAWTNNCVQLPIPQSPTTSETLAGVEGENLIQWEYSGLSPWMRLARQRADSTLGKTIIDWFKRLAWTNDWLQWSIPQNQATSETLAEVRGGIFAIWNHRSTNVSNATSQTLAVGGVGMREFSSTIDVPGFNNLTHLDLDVEKIPSNQKQVFTKAMHYLPGTSISLFTGSKIPFSLVQTCDMPWFKHAILPGSSVSLGPKTGIQKIFALMAHLAVKKS